MEAVTTAAFLHLCLCATAAVSDVGSTETLVLSAPGDIAILPCYTGGDVPPTLTTWGKSGREVASSRSPAAAGRRVAVTTDGSLSIGRVARGDEGAYLCSSTLPGNNTFHARVSLQVASGPENVSASIGPATALANGTLVVFRGSSVSFNCSGASYPAQRLTWASPGNESLASTSGPWLNFRMEGVQPGAQGLYSCRARNPVSGREVNTSSQLLVYYVPDRHPECTWAPAQDPSHTLFNCTWFGGYPTPTLRWGEDEGNGSVYASGSTESLSVTLDRSVLSDGQTLRCAARHPALAAGPGASCSFTLRSPYPEGEPLVTALEATDVTLTCTEAASLPPANTTWRRGLRQEAVAPGWKYVVSEEGPVLQLKILNISKDDEGVYFCRSENALAVRELEVYLTVKTSSTYTGAILGVFIAALIVGSAAIVAKTLFFNRHRFCLGDGFGHMESDRGDVLSLVESDDEQVFQDAVPRLAPLANGLQTTLVQMHRIPSSDHEDADTRLQQQEDTRLQQQEDTRLQQQEDTRLQQQEDTRLQQQEDTRLQQQEDTRLQQQEDTRLQQQEDTRLQQQEDTRLQQQEDTRLQQQEDTRLQQQEDTRLQQQEDTRLQQQEDTRLQQQEDTRLQQQEDTRLQQQEDTRLQQQEDTRLQQQEDTRLQQQEDTRLQQQEDTRLQQQEDTRLQQQEDTRLQQQEDTRLQQQEDTALTEEPQDLVTF